MARYPSKMTRPWRGLRKEGTKDVLTTIKLQNWADDAPTRRELLTETHWRSNSGRFNPRLQASQLLKARCCVAEWKVRELFWEDFWPRNQKLFAGVERQARSAYERFK